jgi:hypothetical protein
MHGPTCIFWANLTPFSLKGSTGATEGSWTQQEGSIDGPVQSLSLAFGFFSTSRDTEAYFDNIVLYGDGPAPAVMSYEPTCIARKGREACSSTSGVCGSCLHGHTGLTGESNEACIDCTGSPSCGQINREACSTVANTCGAIIKA